MGSYLALQAILTAAITPAPAGTPPAVAPPAPAALAPQADAPATTRILPRDRREDLFVGPSRAVRLSAPGLLWGSEVCLLDGRTLEPWRDYEADYAAGMLRLTRQPPQDAVLVITYRLQPFNTPSVPQPDLAHTALEKRLADVLARPNPGVPSGGAAKTVENQSLSDQLLSGLRLTELRDHLTGANSSTARIAYLKTDALDPSMAGSERETFSTDLNLKPSPGSRLLFSSQFARESPFSEEFRESERRRLQFEQTLGKSTAALMWERRRSDGYGVASALDAVSLSLAHPFTRNTTAEGFFSHENSLYLGPESRSVVTLRQMLGSLLEAQASLGYRASEYAGNSLETGLTLFAHPGASDLNVTLRQSSSDRYGRFQRMGADLTAPLSSKVQLLGQVSRRTSEEFGSLDSFGLGMAARPTTRSLLEAAFSESTGGGLGQDRSHTLRLSLDPSAALRLNLGYDLLNSSRDGRSQNALWMLSVGGQRYVKLEGYAGTYAPKDESFYNDALYRVEARPLEHLTLSGSVRKVESEEDDRALGGVGATVRLLNMLDLSAGYRRPFQSISEDPGTSGHDLRLGFSPLSGLRFFGEYAVRPEDERGLLLDQRHHSLGMETRLGGLSLVGSVTRMQGASALEPGQRLDFLASLSLGIRTRLYGGIRTEDPLETDTMRSQIYRLGITQTAGPSFFLLLEGQFGWQQDGTGTRSFSPDDARAQARLGLRF